MKGSARADGKNSVRGLSAGVPAPKGTVRRNESKRVVTSSLARATTVFRNEKKSSFKKLLSSFARIARAKNDARLLSLHALLQRWPYSFVSVSRLSWICRSSASVPTPGSFKPHFSASRAASGATAAARFLASRSSQPSSWSVAIVRRSSRKYAARDVGVFSTAFTRWFQVDRPSLSVKISCGCSASQKKGEFHHSHDNTQYVPRSARQDVAPFASHLASRDR